MSSKYPFPSYFYVPPPPSDPVEDRKISDAEPDYILSQIISRAVAPETAAESKVENNLPKNQAPTEKVDATSPAEETTLPPVETTDIPVASKVEIPHDVVKQDNMSHVNIDQDLHDEKLLYSKPENNLSKNSSPALSDPDENLGSVDLREKHNSSGVKLQPAQDKKISTVSKILPVESVIFYMSSNFTEDKLLYPKLDSTTLRERYNSSNVILPPPESEPEIMVSRSLSNVVPNFNLVNSDNISHVNLDQDCVDKKLLFSKVETPSSSEIVTPKLSQKSSEIKSSENIPHPEYTDIPEGTTYDTSNLLFEDEDLQEVVNLSSEVVYDELPDEIEFRRVDGIQSVAHLFEPSNKILETLKANFDISKHKILTPEMEVENTTQYFIIDKIKYLLEDDEELNQMYETISSLNNLSSSEIIRKSKSSLFADLTQKLTELLQNNRAKFTLPFIASLTSEEISKIIVVVLNNSIRLNMDNISKKEDSMQNMFQCQHVYYSVGLGLANLYLTRVFFNKLCDDEIVEIYDLGKTTKIKNTAFLNIVQQATTKVYDRQSIETFIAPYKFKDTTEYTLFCNLLSLNLSHNKIITHKDENIQFDFESALIKSIRNICLNVGTTIFYCLIENKVFHITTDTKQIPYLILDENLRLAILASATFFKPFLAMSNSKKIPSSQKILQNLITISHTLKTHKFKDSKNTTIKTIDSTFDPMLTQAGSTPLKVDAKITTLFFTFFADVYCHAFNETREDLNLMFKIMYDIDFKVILAHTSNPTLIIELMKHAFSFNTFSDRELQSRCHQEKDAAAIAIYDKISSYKYYIYGSCGELNIYKKFRHFYVPKYMTSSGRLYSHVLFLQMQGNKFALNFIKIATLKHITEASYLKLRTAMLETLPNLPKNNVLQNLSFTDYNKTNKKLFITYIKSLFKPNTDLQKDFLVQQTPISRLLWIASNIKKNKNILLAYALITSLLDGTWHECLYPCDATSSGLQLISIIMRDKQLAF